MLRSIGRWCSKTDSYGSAELAEEWSESLVCCIYEAEHKDARCCSLVTVNEDTPDFFQCGNMNDRSNMSTHDLARKTTERYIRWLLFISVIIVGLIGGASLLRPDAVVFNTLVDEVSAARLNEGLELQEQAKHREEALNKLDSDDANSQILMTFLNKVFASKDTSQDEKRAIKEMMERAASKIDSAHAERTTIVSPMIIYGALNLYYAIKCVLGLLRDVRLEESITHDHILWCVCNLIGYVIAAANRGHGMQTTQVTIFLLIYYVCMALSWVFIHQRILYNTYTLRTEIPQLPSPSTPSILKPTPAVF